MLNSGNQRSVVWILWWFYSGNSNSDSVFYCGSMYDRYGTGYEIYKPWFVYAGSRY